MNPAASRIRPVSSVVVDLPFVPVIAITRPRSQRDASSTSPITGTPRARAAATTGSSGGTPGLRTTRSALGERLRRMATQFELDAEPPQRFDIR